MDILIMGAGGQIARYLIQYILEGRKHRAKVMLQNEAQVAYFEEKGVKSVIYKPGEPHEKFVQAIETIDALVLADNGVHAIEANTLAELDEMTKLLEIVERTAVKRIIQISTFETKKEDWMQFPVYFRPIMIKNYHVDQWLRLSSLDYTIIHPGELNDKKGTGNINVVGDDIMRGEIPKEDVARVILACLEDQSSIRKEFKIISGKLSIIKAINELDKWKI